MNWKELLRQDVDLSLLKGVKGASLTSHRAKSDPMPAKRHMNLYHRVEKSTKRATIALYVLFAAVVLAAAGKFLVFDLWSEVRTLEKTQVQYQQQLESCENDLKDYDDVAFRYSLYAKTPEEEAQTDRMDILDLLDTAIRPTASIESISIGGDQVLVQFSGISLRQTAEIVQQIESSDLVSGTHVDTAFTPEDTTSVVQANLLIDLVSKDNTVAADGTTEGSEAQ